MIRLSYIYAGLLGAVALTAWSETTINKIEFRGGLSPVLEIGGDGPLAIQKSENPEDSQVILEIRDAVLAKSVSRKLDTSSFPGPVSLISPYQISGDPSVTRIVVQLREASTAELSQTANRASIRFISGGSPAIENQPKATQEGSTISGLDPVPGTEEATTGSEQVSSSRPSTASETQVAEDVATSQASASTDRDSAENKMDQFIEARQTRQFIGRPISLQVKDADVQDILRMIGEASGFNIVIGEAVKGNLTLSLTDVPWDQVLDLVLTTLRLGAERSNNVLRIETLENLTRQKQQELQARIASEMSAQRITRIFPISYARINELATILQSFAVPRVQGAQGGTPDTNAIVIQSDQRTNSLIVQGTPETVERIRKLIQLLDTQTPQVMIEAKIVEASERFSRSLGGSMGLATGRSFASFNGGDPSTVLQAQASTGGSALFGSAPVVGFLPGVQRLNALLSISESENETKIITSPRVVVLNRQAANITQTQPVLINVLTINNGVQTVTPQQLNANISLNVTPTVTNDGSVLLDLNLQRDVPTGGGQPTIANRNMKTSVIVDSGSTLVVGGIFSNDEINSESGMPFLRKIPIIGTLLGDKQKSTARSELFFFVTPKILNQSESGLQTGSNT